MPPSKEDLKRIDGLNYAAVMQTIEHHGKCIGEIDAMIKGLQAQLNTLQQELVQQRGLIVRSLQQAYGHGSTS